MNKENLESKNKLFIVCPFSFLEPFIRKQYGNNSFFLTCSGGVLPDFEFEYIEAVKQFIIREKIKTIYIVNDVSCRFINSIINRKKLIGLGSEKTIEELYVDHYLSAFKGQSIKNQAYNLAKLNIENQAIALIESSLLGNCIADYGIEIKGLITSKERKIFQEFQIESYTHRLYEL